MSLHAQRFTRLQKCQVSLLSTVSFLPSTLAVPVMVREQPGQQKCWRLLGPQRSPAAWGNTKVEEAQRQEKALLLQEVAAPAAMQGMLPLGQKAKHSCLMPSLTSCQHFPGFPLDVIQHLLPQPAQDNGSLGSLDAAFLQPCSFSCWVGLIEMRCAACCWHCHPLQVVRIWGMVASIQWHPV